VSGDRWIALGASVAGLAVICGAFAAHGLDTQLPKQYVGQTRIVAGETVPAARKYIADFKTAADYQMYHALGMIAVGLIMHRRPAGSLTAAGWCFLLGTMLFSGSLYALVLTGVTKLGMVTPIGGVLFIVGWGALAVGMILRTPTTGETP
jgi:uncharacterized membrane protein YgdD (TMEM256/DUF423 family)